MAEDEPIAMFSIDLGGGDGDAADGAESVASGGDLGPQVSRISASVDGIGRNVAALLGVTQTISQQVAAVASRLGAGAASSVGMAAGTPGAAMRPPVAPAAAVAIPASARGAVRPPAAVTGPIPVPSSSRVGGSAVRTALNVSTNLGRILAGGFAVTGALAPLFVGRMAARAGEQSLRRLSNFSPQIAGFQSAVDVSGVLSNIAIANDPMVTRAARYNAEAQIRFNQGMQNINRFKEVLLNVGGGAAYDIVPYFLRQSGLFGAALYSLGWQNNQSLSPAANNQQFESILNGLTGGLLEMQETVLPSRFLRGRGRPTRVRWRGDGWERSPM